MSLIHELRHRNVFRVAVAYCVISWLIAQVADLAADNFGAPDWVMRMLLVLLLLGLPVALFLAWAYELTPAGIVKADQVPEGAPKDPRSGRILNRIIIATLVLTVAGLAWDRVRVDSGVTETETAGAVTDKSVAVLPFADFSPGGDQAWFADGLTDEILNALARTRDLVVASRTSSFAFRDSALEIPAIAAKLGVAHVLEGSVRRSDDRIRVTAQLIRAADDKHLWSETFDGRSDDSIEIQETIALSIARALETTMDPDELTRMLDAGTNSVEAWEKFLLARSLTLDRTDGDDAVTVSLLREATTIDPGFYDAHTFLSEIYLAHLRPVSMTAGSLGLPKSELRERAVASLSAAANSARSEFDRLEVQFALALLEVRLRDAIDIAERRVELMPASRSAHTVLGAALLMAGATERAAEALKAAANLKITFRDSPSPGALFQYLARADIDAAITIVEQALAVPTPSLDDVYQAHRALLMAGRVDAAAELERDFLRRSRNENSKLMVRIRQACAEGRVADADAIFAEAERRVATGEMDKWQDNIWLYLKTLGRYDDAREMLRELETPDDLYALSSHLHYPHFEPREHPLLWKTLLDQGIERPPARPLSFACRR